MRHLHSKRIISLLLIIVMALTASSCSQREHSSEAGIEELSIIIEESSAEKESTISESDSTTASKDTSLEASSSVEASSEDPSSEEASSEEPSSEEASSEEPSSEDESSEDSSSEDESSEDDISAVNPYEGTDIKPAEGKVIAFTFDDGPSYTSSTTKILDKLEELGMSATFFVVGERVSASSAPVIRRMLDLGCDLGNHSFSHPNFNQMSVAQVQKQINDTNARLENYVGSKATLIRPPYGNITTSQMEKLNTPIICWDIDSLDWDLRDAQKIYDRTIARVHDGGIVLMHDIYDTTAEAFCMLADELVAQGYTLVTISELLGTEKLMCTTVKYGFQW